jgi:Ser/Thr protein kinase RdoA (MazF antagonist)
VKLTRHALGRPTRDTDLMPSSLPAAATRAAVAVAAGLGVASGEPAVLADGANIVVHLSPAPIVAKVAASTPAVRADNAAWLRRELDLAVYLAGAGIPVMTPSREVPVAVHEGDGFALTFWTYLERSGTEPPDEKTIGSMLHDLHAALRGYPSALPVLAPLGDIPAFLARPQTRLSHNDAAMLAGAFGELTSQLVPDGQALHGDAGAGNLMPTDAGWVWHDFEDTCSGPVGWDLAATTASPWLNRDRILAAYGEPVDDKQLVICQRLRRLHLTIWYNLYAERLPDCRPRADDLLAEWRAQVG